jgi:hypothetical protein
VEAIVLVELLARLFTPKLNESFEAASVEVPAVVRQATVEGAVAKPVKTGAVVDGVAVCLKGIDKGTEVGGPMLSKMGFKVKVVVPVVAGRVELEEPPGVAEGLWDMGLSLSILGGVRKRGWDMGQAEDKPGVVGEEGLGGPLFKDTSNRMLFGEQSSGPLNASFPATPGVSSPGFRVGARSRGPWAFTEVSALGAAYDLVFMSSVMVEAGGSPWKATEEVPGREEPRGS